MIIAKDQYIQTSISSIKAPKLKGHVKITLHNVHNKKNEVVEGDNIITNAVADLFSNNYLGALDMSSLFPIWEKWYGGILCFQNTHALHNGVLDPDQYYPRADSINHLTAHAGQTAIDVDHDDDLTRGNPTKSAYIKTASSIKQVFEWGTTHGNGQISALSLTHSDVGSYGLGNNSYHFRNTFAPFAVIGTPPAVPIALASANSIFTQYDECHGMWFHIDKSDAYSYGNTLKTSGTSWITIILRKLPYTKSGLYETQSADTQFPITIEVETSIIFYNQPSYYFDYENKKLWLFTNILSGGRSHDSSHMNYSIIDLSDLENVAEDDYGTINSDTANLAPSCMEQTASSYNPSVARNANIVKIGDYVYLPTTSGAVWSGAGYTPDYFNINGFKKININSQSDQTQISFNSSDQSQLRPYMGGGDFLVGSGYVCNGTVGFPCVAQFDDAGWNATPSAISWATHSFNQPQNPSSLFNFIGGCAGSSSQPRYIFANKLLLTSKFNMNPVQKTSSHSMTIEYTLQEVSE